MSSSHKTGLFIVLPIAAIFVNAILSFNTFNESNTVISKASANSLLISPNQIDLGTVRQYHKANFRFCLTNNETERIRIDKVEWSCGCTQASVGNMDLNSGESTVLIGTLDAGSRIGEFGSTIIITARTKGGKIITTTVKAKANAAAAAELEPLVLDFGNLISSQVIKPQIITIKRGKADVKWDGVKVQADTGMIYLMGKSINSDLFSILVTPKREDNKIFYLHDTVKIQLMYRGKPVDDCLYGIPVTAQYSVTGITINPQSVYLGVVERLNVKSVNFKINCSNDVSSAKLMGLSGKDWNLDSQRHDLHQLSIYSSVITPEKMGAFCYQKDILFESNHENYIATISAFGYVKN